MACQKHNGKIEKTKQGLARAEFLSLFPMNAPCTFSLKNQGISQYFDVSYLNFSRNGDKRLLKQNQQSEYLDRINSFEYTSSFLNEVNEVQSLYKNHVDYMKKKYDVDLKPLGTLSKAQVKSCKKACETMINTVMFSKDNKVDYKTGQYVVFVTLTIPGKQIHSDKEIKLLQTRYIENLQKTYGVKYYVWKAETHKSGNIHFHLLLDKWIHWTVHRKLWNKQLDKLGYLDRHFEKNGNRNPNSIDVHSLKTDKKGRKIKNPTKYIIKYMTKLEFGKRPVLGKLWGCSSETKRLDYPKYCEGDYYFSHVVSLINSDQIYQTIKEDFFSYFSGRVYNEIYKKYKDLWSSIKTFYKLQNGNIKPAPIPTQPFIRSEKYESVEEFQNRLAKDKKDFLENNRIEKNKKALRSFKQNYVKQFGSFENQLEFNYL
ncbi:rolling circle replication-associated protein [Tenacibaculum amylolyticum]|uniref:rolling circle replication-associated protein n=1 Tax=Tenacibaculum amylolyticum TaxID=104269 RepID=UPI003892ECC4